MPTPDDHIYPEFMILGSHDRGRMMTEMDLKTVEERRAALSAPQPGDATEVYPQPRPPEFPSLTVFGKPVNEPKDHIETFPNPNPGHQSLVTMHEKEFTCLCPIVGAPDFAEILIEYTPGANIAESKSVKLYLWSFRDQKKFHEAIVGEIADRFMMDVEPIAVIVTGIFNPRGGIGITVSVARYLDEEPSLYGGYFGHVIKPVP